MNGPYIQVAAFAERVLEERGEVLSLIRVIDSINVQAHGANAPDELPATDQINVSLVLMLKSGDARGRHPLTIEIETPVGHTLPAQTIDATFDGGVRGVQLVLAFLLDAVEGTFWFHVKIHDRVVTRMPLTVTYQRGLR